MSNLTNAQRHLEHALEYLSEEMMNEEDVGNAIALANIISGLVEIEKTNRLLSAGLKKDIIVLRGEDE